ncbi:hypothetical protein DX908_10395 [Parvularcula marina]|uniref:Uncharacterized protein n=1 Tax=Parvularcula marina TaxID=2292771 RepID=A0A371RJM0_9PROT|nr:hypothetical protein DX908_10395 [Parvularcula marina]
MPAQAGICSYITKVGFIFVLFRDERAGPQRQIPAFAGMSGWWEPCEMTAPHPKISKLTFDFSLRVRRSLRPF